MKIMPAFMTASLRRRADTLRAQLTAVYAPPPPGYYGDFGPPPRYAMAVSRGRDPRDCRRPRSSYDRWRD